MAVIVCWVATARWKDTRLFIPQWQEPNWRGITGPVDTCYTCPVISWTASLNCSKKCEGRELLSVAFEITFFVWAESTAILQLDYGVDYWKWQQPTKCGESPSQWTFHNKSLQRTFHDKSSQWTLHDKSSQRTFHDKSSQRTFHDKSSQRTFHNKSSLDILQQKFTVDISWQKFTAEISQQKFTVDISQQKFTADISQQKWTFHSKSSQWLQESCQKPVFFCFVSFLHPLTWVCLYRALCRSVLLWGLL